MSLESRRYPGTAPSEWVEEQIFDGFVGSHDTRLMDEFRASSPAERPLVATKFDDRRIRELAHRIVYMESPDLLDPKIKDWFDDWRSRRIHKPDSAAKFRSLEEAKKEATELVANPERFDSGLVEQVLAWLESIEA